MSLGAGRGRRATFALSPRRTILGWMPVAATLAIGLSACAPEGPDASSEEEPQAELAVRNAGGEPGLDVLASFARQYLLNAMIAEEEQSAVAKWYFVNGVLAPYAYDGRQYPPEDTRAWIERAEPILLNTRQELERLGFSVCDIGSEEEPCDDAVRAGNRHFALIGIGESGRTGETGWSYDFGFVVVAPSGVSTGEARVAIRPQEGMWSLTSARGLWVAH